MNWIAFTKKQTNKQKKTVLIAKSSCWKISFSYPAFMLANIPRTQDDSLELCILLCILFFFTVHILQFSRTKDLPMEWNWNYFSRASLPVVFFVPVIHLLGVILCYELNCLVDSSIQHVCQLANFGINLLPVVMSMSILQDLKARDERICTSHCPFHSSFHY